MFNLKYTSSQINIELMYNVQCTSYCTSYACTLYNVHAYDVHCTIYNVPVYYNYNKSLINEFAIKL